MGGLAGGAARAGRRTVAGRLTVDIGARAADGVVAAEGLARGMAAIVKRTALSSTSAWTDGDGSALSVGNCCACCGSCSRAGIGVGSDRETALAVGSCAGARTTAISGLPAPRPNHGRPRPAAPSPGTSNLSNSNSPWNDSAMISAYPSTGSRCAGGARNRASIRRRNDNLSERRGAFSLDEDSMFGGRFASPLRRGGYATGQHDGAPVARSARVTRRCSPAAPAAMRSATGAGRAGPRPVPNRA